MRHSIVNVGVRLAEASEARFLSRIDSVVSAQNCDLSNRFEPRDSEAWRLLLNDTDSPDKHAVALLGGALYAGYFVLNAAGIRDVFNERYSVHKDEAATLALELHAKLFPSIIETTSSPVEGPVGQLTGLGVSLSV